MDEEQLKELLGDNFEGAKDFFKGQVLGGGEYVRKEMADAEKAKLTQALTEANEKIKAKMSDDEKAKALEQANLDTIEELKKKLLEQTLITNQSKAVSNVSEAIALADVKKEDKEFSKFIENISLEDATKTDEISKYVSKIVKSAYEKGKAEATKQNLSKIGDFNANAGDGSDSNKKESLAARLAKENTVKKVESNYFKN